MFKEFAWYAFTDKCLSELVYPESEHKYPSASLSALTGLLARLGCQSVLAESSYIDRDYKNEYATFYCKRFKDYPARCLRLHFLKSVAADAQTVNPALWSTNDYLGFSVIRPTEFNRIGRTVVRPPEDEQTYITCGTEFSSHLFGHPFRVKAAPFIQQDTHVGVCAHASLWMVAYYLHQFGLCGRFGMGDVNYLAKRYERAGRDFPSDQGLSQQQMLDALQGMGLHATLYTRDSLPGRLNMVEGIDVALQRLFPKLSGDDLEKVIQSMRLAEIAYRSIESRLPVIFTTNNHSFVGVGHTLNLNAESPVIFDRVPAFIVNDDASGPYQKLPLIPKHDGKRSFLDVTGLFIVTPESATLPGEHAEEQARSLVESFKIAAMARNDFEPLRKILNTRHEFRTYLLNSTELQQRLQAAAESHPKESHVHELQRLDYPHYVWVVEIFLHDHDRSGAGANRKLIGRCFFDSTASHFTNSLIYMNYGPWILFHDRQGKVSDIQMWEVAPQPLFEINIA